MQQVQVNLQGSLCGVRWIPLPLSRCRSRRCGRALPLLGRAVITTLPPEGDGSVKLRRVPGRQGVCPLLCCAAALESPKAL